MTSFDIDQIVYNLLINSEVKQAISGGIYYQDDRPDDSHKEDIVINTISMTQEHLPQLATSNINIYVADKALRIDGKEQRKPNRERLHALTALVLDVVRASRVTGLAITPEAQTIIQEASTKQHFCNIRLAWNIQTTKKRIRYDNTRIS